MTIRETRQALSHLDRLLASEGEVTITRRGEAIARVTQLGRKRPIPTHRDLRNKMPRMRKGSEKLIREERDARRARTPTLIPAPWQSGTSMNHESRVKYSARKRK